MRLPILAIATLLAAGCGSQSANQQSAGREAGNNQQVADGEAAPAPAQAAAASAGGRGSLNIQPGQWEITMEMQSAQASGMPAGVTMPQIPPTTMRSCLTPEQVSQANGNFLNGGSGHAGMTCDYSGVTVADGRIQGTSTCSRQGMEARVTMDGSFTPTSYDIHQQMQSTMHGRSMSSTNHLVGRRIGECTPGQTNAIVAPGTSRDGR